MARALFRILVGWILLTSLLAVSFAAVAEEGEPVGIARAIIEREEGPPCECTAVLFEDAIADRIGDRLGFQAEGTIEGRCKSAPSDDPDIVETFCFAGVYGEGRMIGVYSGFNKFGLVRGGWQATYDPAAPDTPVSQVFAQGAGPGGPKNRGQSREGAIYWTKPGRSEVEEALECSRFLREVFGRIEWPDPWCDVTYHTVQPPEKPSEIDIRQVVQEEGSVWINIEPYGLIPSSPNGSLRYQIYFDIDLDPATGIPIREDLGAEFTVWVGFDAPFAGGQWAAALFRKNDAGGFDQITLLPNEEWDIGASRIRVRIPLSEMGDVQVLHWLCLTATETAADWAPNEGVGFWFDTQAL